MVASAWIDTVWRMNGAKSPVIGRIRSVDGEYMTLSVIGLRDQNPIGAEILPGEGGIRRYARMSVEVLLRNWCRVETGAARAPQAS
jgi:hypothetical protein